jgi:nucleoside-diphosphate-sugar epimerase
MHIVIFGATGLTGRCLVEQALDEGYDVTAFARNPASVSTQHVRLSIVMIGCGWLCQDTRVWLDSVRLAPGISLRRCRRMGSPA